VNKSQIADYLYGNRVAIGSGFALLLTAAIKTAPEPGTPMNAYTWAYDWFHQVFNITNSRNRTSPGQPASPK
jgi:hypothetical protein